MNNPTSGNAVLHRVKNPSLRLMFDETKQKVRLFKIINKGDGYCEAMPIGVWTFEQLVNEMQANSD